VGEHAVEAVVGVGVGVSVGVGFGKDLAEVVVCPGGDVVAGVFQCGLDAGLIPVAVGDGLVLGIGGGDEAV